MRKGPIGKDYADSEVIVRQGDVDDCMYVLQAGTVEVVQKQGDGEQRLALLRPGEFFGEMAIFAREERSATVRALGDAKVLKLDKKTLLRRISEDPLLAVKLLEKLSARLLEANRLLSENGAGG